MQDKIIEVFAGAVPLEADGSPRAAEKTFDLVMLVPARVRITARPVLERGWMTDVAIIAAALIDPPTVDVKTINDALEHDADLHTDLCAKFDN